MGMCFCFNPGYGIWDCFRYGRKAGELVIKLQNCLTMASDVVIKYDSQIMEDWPGSDGERL